MAGNFDKMIGVPVWFNLTNNHTKCLAVILGWSTNGTNVEFLVMLDKTYGTHVVGSLFQTHPNNLKVLTADERLALLDEED